MATITKRKRADGSMSFRAEIRIKQKGVIVHQEAKTFDQRKLAEAWSKARETALQAPGAIQTARAQRSIADLLTWYGEVYGAAFGRTKRAHIEFMKTWPLARENALAITAEHLISHIKERRVLGAGPATANNDLMAIRTVFKAARPALGIDLNLQAIDDAAAFCRAQRLVAKAKRRKRRLRPDEEPRLMDYFSRRDGRATIPMADIMQFALHSARREGEITRILWDDNNERDHTGVVRDAKHPTAKEGNHRTFKYTAEGWEIVKRQPKTAPEIFPYNPKSISSAFTRACHVLEIKDLDFHDLRHEATSRLFERGYAIQEVQQFTLHESWATLQIYTHLRPGDVQHR